jgi:hypothetical protein
MMLGKRAFSVNWTEGWIGTREYLSVAAKQTPVLLLEMKPWSCNL